MSDRMSQILTSRDCSFTFLTVYTTTTKETSSYNLQWQEIINVCTMSLLKQNKLGCRGDTSPTDSPTPPKKIKLSQPPGRYDFWFWDAEKGIPVSFIYSGTTISARTCRDILWRLREAVRKNWPDLLSRGVIIKQHYSSSNEEYEMGMAYCMLERVQIRKENFDQTSLN